MVLLPKGGGESRGVGLVEVIWKLCASIINNLLWSYIILHDSLHEFRQGMGTGISNLEEKLEQQLAGIFHKPLLQVLLDVRKAYNSLDRGRYMEILKGYGLGPKLQRLL